MVCLLPQAAAVEAKLVFPDTRRLGFTVGSGFRTLPERVGCSSSLRISTVNPFRESAKGLGVMVWGLGFRV